MNSSIDTNSSMIEIDDDKSKSSKLEHMFLVQVLLVQVVQAQ
jgi:hypothetical protein